MSPNEWIALMSLFFLIMVTLAGGLIWIVRNVTRLHGCVNHLGWRMGNVERHFGIEQAKGQGD